MYIALFILVETRHSTCATYWHLTLVNAQAETSFEIKCT